MLERDGQWWDLVDDGNFSIKSVRIYAEKLMFPSRILT